MDFRIKRKRMDVSDDTNSSITINISVKRKENFAASAMHTMNLFRQSGVLCDVKLVGGPVSGTDATNRDSWRGEAIPAHRCVLAAKSDYFKAMFTIGMNESKEDIIRIHQVSHGILTQVVAFMYNGSCKMNRDEVPELTSAAAMMQIPSLLRVCEEYLVKTLSVCNVFTVWSLSDSFQLVRVLECCEEFIPNHLGVLLKQEEFSKLTASMINAILKLPKVNLGPQHEQQILREGLQNWVRLNQGNDGKVEKLEGLVDFEKLNITPNSICSVSPNRADNLQASDRVTTLPSCYSLIAVMGGFLQSRTGAQCPTANTIEIFDTSSLSWQSSHAIRTEARPVLFRTVFKSDGMFYFLSKDKYDVNLYQYEPVLSQWNFVRGVDSSEALWRLADSISHVRAVAANGHEIFFCGSVTVKSADNGKVAFKVDVKKNAVEELPLLPYPRYHHGTVVVDGDLCVIGGSTLSWEPLKTILILRQGHASWEEGACMSTSRVGPGVAALGGFIYVAGGTSTNKGLKTVERYHLASNRWEPIPPMHHPRTFPGAVAAGGCLFIFGGKSYGGNAGIGTRNVLRSCEKFDPATNEWVELPPMDKCRCEMVTLTV